MLHRLLPGCILGIHEPPWRPDSATRPSRDRPAPGSPSNILTRVFRFWLGAGSDVSMIYLLTRAAGSIDGVRVGDGRDEVIAHWGEPPLAQGAQAMYPAGDWAVVVELGAEQRVVSISLGRAYGNTDLR